MSICVDVTHINQLIIFLTTCFFFLLPDTLKSSTTMWSRWTTSILLVVICWIAHANTGSSHNSFKINPKPCTVNGIEGTCMFVWECIKSEGQHVGVCMDSFMFGSCCSHNLTENVIPQNYHQTLNYLSKPGGGNKYKPPKPRYLASLQNFVNNQN